MPLKKDTEKRIGKKGMLKREIIMKKTKKESEKNNPNTEKKILKN